MYTGRVHGHYTTVYSPSTRPKTAVCTAVYTVPTQPCTRAVHTNVYGPCTRPFSAVYTATTRPCTLAVHTAAYTARRVCATYTVVYMGRCGQLRACTRADTAHTWPRARPVHGRVRLHVYSCTRAVWTARSRPAVYTARAPPFTEADTARTSLGHPSTFQWVSRLDSVTARHYIVVPCSNGRAAITLGIGPHSSYGVGPLVFFFYSLWLLLHMVWPCSANLECRPEMCCARNCWKYRTQKLRKNRHLGAIAQLCRAASSQLRYLSTMRKHC